MSIGSAHSSEQEQLFEAAVRVLTKCANGQHPSPADVQFLESQALPNEGDMEPAELAGAIVWRIFRANNEMGARSTEELGFSFIQQP